MWPIACLVSRWILQWWELWCMFKVLGRIMNCFIKVKWVCKGNLVAESCILCFYCCWCSSGFVWLFWTIFLGFFLFVYFPDTKGEKSQWAYSYLCVGKYLIQNTFFPPNCRPTITIIINNEMLSKVSWFQILICFENALELFWVLSQFLILTSFIK